MFMKLFVVCCVFYTVQVLAGPIKPPMSANCQALEDEIELANFKMRQICARSEMSYKELEKSSQNKVKLSLKQLNEAIKSGIGTTSQHACCDEAAMEQKPLETKFKQDLKICKTKANFRELKKSATLYLRELKGHASVIDKYCALMCEDKDSVPNCVDESVSKCQASLVTIEKKINQGLAQLEKEIRECYHILTESIYYRSLTLQNDIQSCMEAANDDESGSKSGTESDESDSDEDSKETTTVPKNEDDENHGGEDNDNPEPTTTEVAIEDGDNGEDGDRDGQDGDGNDDNPSEGNNEDKDGNDGQAATTGDNSNDINEENKAGNYEVEEGDTGVKDDGEVELTNVAEDGNYNEEEEEEEEMPGEGLSKSLLAISSDIQIEVTTLVSVGGGVAAEVPTQDLQD